MQMKECVINVELGSIQLRSVVPDYGFNISLSPSVPGVADLFGPKARLKECVGSNSIGSYLDNLKKIYSGADGSREKFIKKRYEQLTEPLMKNYDPEAFVGHMMHLIQSSLAEGTYEEIREIVKGTGISPETLKEKYKTREWKAIKKTLKSKLEEKYGREVEEAMREMKQQAAWDYQNYEDIRSGKIGIEKMPEYQWEKFLKCTSNFNVKEDIYGRKVLKYNGRIIAIVDELPPCLVILNNNLFDKFLEEKGLTEEFGNLGARYKVNASQYWLTPDTMIRGPDGKRTTVGEFLKYHKKNLKGVDLEAASIDPQAFLRAYRKATETLPLWVKVLAGAVGPALILGCIGQGPGYQTEQDFVKEKGWNEVIGKEYFSMDPDNKAQSTPFEEEFTIFMDSFLEHYPDCIGKTDIKMLIEFWKQNPDLTGPVLEKCLTGRKYMKYLGELARHNPDLGLQAIENGWDLNNPVYQGALELGLSYSTAIGLAFEKQFPEELMPVLKEFDPQTRDAVLKWLGDKNKINEKEAELLKAGSEDPDLRKLFSAWVRGQPPDESPAEFYRIIQYLEMDETVYKNVLQDVENPNSVLNLLGKTITVDQDGDGLDRGLDRKYIDEWPNIPGIDAIYTLENGEPSEKTKTPYWRSKLLTDERNNLIFYYFDVINGNGHMVKLRVYDEQGNPTDNWLWLDIRMEGIQYDSDHKVYLSYIEINNDNDHIPEYIFIYYPAETRQGRHVPFPGLPAHSLSFYPDIKIEKIPVSIGGWGNNTWDIGTWCTVGGTTINGDDNCHASREFRELEKIYWTLIYSPYGNNSSPYPNYPLWLWGTMR